MSRRLLLLLSVAILFILSISLSIAQQDPEKGESVAAQNYASTKLGDGIWHIEDNNRDSMYLVEGSEKAALIDTGMGSGDLPGFVRNLTKLPVGPKYLDYLSLAAQKIIDQGDAALVPSVRPTGIKMVVYGEANDPFAASINVDPDHLLSTRKK